MAGLSVYVETSVWSFVFANDVHDARLHTIEFFRRCRERTIEPFISAVVLEELSRAAGGLREQLGQVVRDVNPGVVDFDERAELLAAAFLRERVVPSSKPQDARHVAAALAAELDVLVSWNFRHIASVRRADRFNAVALLEGFYKPLRIVSPPEVIYDE